LTLLLLMALCWLALTSLGLLGAIAVCRSGHAEDVARGYTDADARATPLP
jgi:hypothetical protein